MSLLSTLTRLRDYPEAIQGFYFGGKHVLSVPQINKATDYIDTCAGCLFHGERAAFCEPVVESCRISNRILVPETEEGYGEYVAHKTRKKLNIKEIEVDEYA